MLIGVSSYPDRILVHGDTTTTFAATLAAYYQRIPVGHIEAGLRTGDNYSPWPEEINRKLTGAIADLHFAPTEKARENLLAENIPVHQIIVTGNTVIDALLDVTKKIANTPEISRQLSTQFSFLDPEKRLILVTGHRRENFGRGFEDICLALKKISVRKDVQIVYPVHLNPNKRVFGLVIDFGTSQSPKSTRPLTTYWCPSRPGHQALRNNFASSLLLRTWLPMTGRRVRRPTLFSLWRKARRGKQCGLAATGVYQPSLRSPWLAACARAGFSLIGRSRQHPPDRTFGLFAFCLPDAAILSGADRLRRRTGRSPFTGQAGTGYALNHRAPGSARRRNRRARRHRYQQHCIGHF